MAKSLAFIVCLSLAFTQVSGSSHVFTTSKSVWEDMMSKMADQETKIKEQEIRIKLQDVKITELENQKQDCKSGIHESPDPPRIQDECEKPVEDCTDVLQQSPTARTGLHQIELIDRFGPTQTALVFCDMDTEGGGWTVIQRRNDGLTNFLQNFQAYADGFGNQLLNSEFWIGNTLLHQITSRWNYELRIDMENANGDEASVYYPSFKVNSECEDFSLELFEAVCGEAGNSMVRNARLGFSTFDHDVDASDDNCAVLHQGAWWYRNCTDANLNGQFLPPGTSAPQSVFWNTWQQQESLAAVTMMIRPKELSDPCETGNVRISCTDILEHDPQAVSGEYDIFIEGCSDRIVTVWCDMETDGGGWTVFQRRIDGSVDFFRNYSSYQEGFGDVSKEFWLGNDNLHQITSMDEFELWVDLTEFDDNFGYARYGVFSIGPESDGYRLAVGEFSGTAGDSLTVYNNNMMFSTYDRDQDTSPGNCAAVSIGAWWYNNCGESSLNGLYRHPGFVGASSMFWYNFHSDLRALKFTEMKLRRKNIS